MKKHYSLFFMLLMLLFASNTFAQECPNSAFTTGTTIFATYSAGTSDCSTRPDEIIVGTSTFSLILCEDTFSQYQLTSGTPVAVSDPFTIDSGFATPCTYVGGVLGLEEIGLVNKASFKVYPNPSSSSINEVININFAIDMSANITLFDVLGKEVLKDSMENTNKKELNVSSLERGIYLLKLSTETITLTKKVVILK